MIPKGDPRGEIHGFTDQSGLVSPWLCSNAVSGSNNGILYTALWLFCLKRSGGLNEEDCQKWRKLMRSCQVRPGLLKRSPVNSTDVEGNDDYIGYLAGCKLTGSGDYAREYLEYGRTNAGCYNNVNPNKWTLRSFLWRQPQLIAHAYYASASQMSGITCIIKHFVKLVWSLTMFLSSRMQPLKDSDSRILSWLLYKTWDKKGYFARRAVCGWLKRLRRDYPNGKMRAVAEIAFPGSVVLLKWFPRI